MNHMFLKSKIIFILSSLVFIITILTGCGNSSTAASTNSKKNLTNPIKTQAVVDPTLTDGNLHIYVLNIGQADATLIQYNGKNMLIDTGDADHRTTLVQQLRAHHVQEIDSIIITHPHGDHLGGMAALFNNFKINQIYDNGVEVNNGMYRNYLKNISAKGIPYKVLRNGDKITLGDDLIFDILAPTEPLFTKENTRKSTSNGITNNNSIVCKLTYHDFTMLFTGDAQKEAEKQLLSNHRGALKADILKVGHHGSKTSTSPAFVQAVSPQAATISCGAGNEYKFPHKPTLDTLQKHSVTVYRTDNDGTISIVSDGQSYNITKEH